MNHIDIFTKKEDEKAASADTTTAGRENDDINQIDDPHLRETLKRLREAGGDIQVRGAQVRRNQIDELPQHQAEGFLHPQASPFADPELQAGIAQVVQPRLVRHLIEQRRDEALFEAQRLQNLLDQSPAEILNCTQAVAQNIFG